MKITINNEHCISGVQKAGSVSPSKTGSSYLKTMWIRASKDNSTVSFMSTDSSTEYSGTFPAEVFEEGPIVGVSSKTLADLISNMPAGLVRMETDEAGSNLIVSQQGKRRYTLPLASSTWFQELSPFPEGQPVTWNGESLTDILEKIAFCIHDEESSGFNCLCVKPNGSGGLDFCGLDGNKFALVTVLNEALLEHLPESGIMLQKKYLADIKKLISSEDVALMVQDSRFYVRDNEGRDMFSVPLLNEQSFVDYSVFLSRVSGDDCSRLLVSKNEFTRALTRMLFFNDNKEEVGVRLTIAQDSITLTCSHKMLGTATETIPAECSGDITDIAFVTKSLLEIMQHLPGETVEMKLSSQEGPCSFKSLDEDSYVIIGMPMHIVNSSYYGEDEA